jgi:hypothetical protein
VVNVDACAACSRCILTVSSLSGISETI